MPVGLKNDDDDRRALPESDPSAPKRAGPPPGFRRFLAIALFTLILLVPVAIFTALRG